MTEARRPASTNAAPLERLLDLVVLLLSSRAPVSTERIFEALGEHYVGERAARDRKLSRDKDALRSLGIPITWVAGAEDDEAGGYILDRAQMYMPDVPLSPSEKASLYAVGAAAVKAGLPMADELANALVKLRFTCGEVEAPASPVIYVRTGCSPHEALITRAVQERRRLRIRYDRGEARLLDPWVISTRRGRFSVVGFCHLRRDVRTFHADRMQSCEPASPEGAGDEFSVPASFDPGPHLPVHPWQLRKHDPIPVRISFTEGLQEIGPRALGIGPDGRCHTTHLDGLVAQVLALGPGARIEEPEMARRRVVEMLSRLDGEAR